MIGRIVSSVVPVAVTGATEDRGQDTTNVLDVPDDGDWPTKYHCARTVFAESKTTITWDIPAGPIGRYRVVHYGDWKSLSCRITPFHAYRAQAPSTKRWTSTEVPLRCRSFLGCPATEPPRPTTRWPRRSGEQGGDGA
jgi:hypothetical protein